MKIDAVELTCIATDEGIEGHALLGSAINPAETDAGALIRFLKPMLMGKDPLAREDLHAAMRARQRSAGLRVIGACDTALWDIGEQGGRHAAPQISRRRARGDWRLCVEPDARRRAGLCAEAARFKTDGWKGYKIHPPQSPREDIKVDE
jgi:Mandelate racemase / muconate lactonizing enzyme, N-terminal domain